MLTLIELTDVEPAGRRASSAKSWRKPSSDGISVNMFVWSAAMTVVGVGSVEQIAMMLPGPAGPRTSIVTGDEPPESIVICIAGMALALIVLFGHTRRA